MHKLLFTAEALLGRLPTYISSLLSFHTSSYCAHSSYRILLNVPRVRTELGKIAFSSYTPCVWNELQNAVTLEALPPLNILKVCLEGNTLVLYIVLDLGLFLLLVFPCVFP